MPVVNRLENDVSYQAAILHPQVLFTLSLEIDFNRTIFLMVHEDRSRRRL
jgi:hypothetical protein